MPQIISHSFWVRLSEVISELYEDLQDSTIWQRILGWCLAFFLNLFLIVTRFRRGDNRMQAGSYKDVDNVEDFLASVSGAEIFLLLFSLANAVYVWARKRRYHFFQRGPSQRPEVANARLVDLKLPYFAQNRIGEYVYEIRSRSGQYVWQVNVWNPDDFTLSLFCGFSPAHVGILILMNPGIWTYYVGTIALLSLQMYVNVYKFSSLVTDRQAIYGEVQREYDNKFVRPRLFVEKQNDSTQTNLNEELSRLDDTWRTFESNQYPEGMDNPWIGSSSSSNLHQDNTT
ncbi:769_t:CDS:2 [Acaulospora colombiana]|uniref:769_t:CDS:1 n=1 Tax=Acaulospora colombiana TaxID=27376 RepID=A0ACA9LAC8_9GLOM|nr:769_t:CDS:2 [Acaulospora colombiana]